MVICFSQTLTALHYWLRSVALCVELYWTVFISLYLFHLNTASIVSTARSLRLLILQPDLTILLITNIVISFTQLNPFDCFCFFKFLQRIFQYNCSLLDFEHSFRYVCDEVLLGLLQFHCG